MILRASSLVEDKLILYKKGNRNEGWIVTIEDAELQWEIYCNDIDVELLTDRKLLLNWRGTNHTLPYWFCSDIGKFKNKWASS